MSEPEHRNIFSPCGFFVLRTPLLPFDELLAWGEGLEAASVVEEPARLGAACAADRVRLRQRLRGVFSRPEVREALFLASPDLEERFALWLQEPEGEQGPKVERALVRYFARMAGRATPFGLFAGCSVGTVGAESRLALAGRPGYRRHTRLDMDYLVLLTDALARAPELRRGLTFGVNTSLYPARGRLRFLEVRRNGKGWTHHQVAIETSEYLEATLARARAGASPAALTAALLERDAGATEEDAKEYLGELLDNQVLVSELRPAVTGPEPVCGLAARLRNEGAGDRLDQARQEIETLDAGGLGAEPARYRRIARLLEDLPGEVQRDRLFQVDMVKPVVAATLGPAVLDEVLRGVMLLQRLARRPREEPLARFREAFVGRFEGREVPLVEALDEDTGVGFDTLASVATDASSLLDGLSFPPAAEETVPWGRREALLLRKLGEALAGGAGEITLDPRDMEEVAGPTPPPLPDAFAVMASVAAASEEALADGDFRVLLHGASGPSGARLLGRFCHADPHLHEFVRQHVWAEEALQPEAVFAEVVHLPEGRVGNILARPVLRAYEIPYLGRAAVPAERQLPVTDLLVSVGGGLIILRSARLGRRVLPRLTSAHNFHKSPGIYRFLCALQAQGTAGELGWDWGPLRDAPFLPRVVSGRLVLARAVWRISRDELEGLGQTPDAARFRAVQQWRRARRLPRWVALADGDNELPIDLDNVLAVDTLVGLVRGQKGATLVELFPGPDHLWAHGPEGRFVQELVVPFVRRPPAPAGGALPGPGLVECGQPDGCDLSGKAGRSFPPGSEWLYAKLYTGPATLDQVLRDVVQPVVDKALGTAAADRWFFVRYGDPDWHLRLRFHGRPELLHGEVLPALQEAATPLLHEGRLWRLQLDTYEREVERYGGAEGVDLAERLFDADSQAVLELTASLPEDARGDVRWRLALLGMDLLLGDLDFDEEGRRAVLRTVRAAFAAEFRADTNLARQLGDKYRKERKGLETLLEAEGEAAAGWGPARAILRRRSERLAPVAAALRAQERAGRLARPLADLAASFLHMHANRLLRSAQRAQELVLYDFLARLYASRAARQIPGGTNPRAVLYCNVTEPTEPRSPGHGCADLDREDSCPAFRAGGGPPRREHLGGR
jgi:thiopeptide-type bacteriocin biosynthesis protein